MAVSCMRNASSDNYRNSSVIVDVAMGQIPRFKERIFVFFDKFPNCRPIQTIFGRNIAEEIWNRLTCGNFDIYLLCVATLHRKMTPTFLSIPQRKKLISHFKQFCDDVTVIEVVFFSL